MKDLLAKIPTKMTAEDQKRSITLAERVGWEMAQLKYHEMHLGPADFADSQTYMREIIDPMQKRREIDDETFYYWSDECRRPETSTDPRVAKFIEGWNRFLKEKFPSGGV